MPTRRVIWISLLLAGWIIGRAGEVTNSMAHWSLQPLSYQPVPNVQSSWPKTPVDQFIYQSLAAHAMAPAAPAEKATLLRRVYFDLIGLPPTPAELKRFENDASPTAFSDLIDRLLDRPEYGERWARHWLDVVHYAETHGHDQDRPRTNSWPYRDYAIASFNSDKPYKQFVEEQIAGDTLYPDDPQATVALGFLATGPWDESSLRDIRDDSIDRQIARYIDRDDIVSTVMNTFVSTTVQCARCHDHKFDPITQKEYYSLQAVFAATDKGNRLYDPDPQIHRKRKALRARKAQLEKPELPAALQAELLSPDFQRRVAVWESSLTPVLRVSNLADEIASVVAVPPAERNDGQKIKLATLVALREVEQELSTLPAQKLVYVGSSDFVQDASFKPAAKPRAVYLLKRGDIHNPGELAKPGALHCVRDLAADFRIASEVSEAERRAALAHWITDAQNPLTWRSIVNRVWHYHFGRGLVSSPNDFGKMGGTPSHPELLDWLACWFRDNGGSVKRLHKLILASAVYQQSSTATPGYEERDADNTLLWRMNRTRLDAESVRDTILAVTGQLDCTIGGPSVQQFLMAPGIHVTPKVDYTGFDVDRPEARRRSIYRFVFRTLPDPFMDSLDCPDSSQLTPVRNTSVTVPQALAMLNDHFTVRYSEHFAERLKREKPGDLEAQIRLAIELAFSRAARSPEISELAVFSQKHGLANLCRVIINSNEFMFVN